MQEVNKARSDSLSRAVPSEADVLERVLCHFSRDMRRMRVREEAMWANGGRLQLIRNERDGVVRWWVK